MNLNEAKNPLHYLNKQINSSRRSSNNTKNSHLGFPGYKNETVNCLNISDLFKLSTKLYHRK